MMDSAPPAKPLKSSVEAYKPQLCVDVTAEPPDDVDNSTWTTPQQSPSPHVSTNIFVAGIPPSWDESDLRKKYQKFGDIISTKIVRERHFAFVMFRTPDSAHAAINETHLTQPIPNSPVLLHVSIAMHDEGVDDVPNDRIFIRGLPQWATKDHLKQCFSRFGTIVDSAVLMNPLGQCKGSGFVQFSSLEEATAAIEARKSVRIENWDKELEVKYSETAEVKQQRQERNKNRQKHSPKYRQHHHHHHSYSLVSPPVSVLPSMPTFSMLSMPTQFPLFYPPSTLAAGALSPHVLYPSVVTPPAMPVYPTQPVVLAPTPEIFSSNGDVVFWGGDAH